MKFKFAIGNKVKYKGATGKIEDTAVDREGSAIYLVSFPDTFNDHWYKYIYEHDLKEI